MEHTPDTQPALFEPVRGRRARRSRETGEVWQADLLHDGKRHAEAVWRLSD
jgi:hypothetical protein